VGLSHNNPPLVPGANHAVDRTTGAEHVEPPKVSL
jgi:hypothetical protein